MSKRLMAIQETFSTNLTAPHPLSITRNGDVNKNQKCETNSSSSLAPTAPAAPVAPCSQPSTLSSSPPAPSKPYKPPNSLILVPNHQQTMGQICNGQVRLVSQGRQAAAKSAVEVQTEGSPPPPPPPAPPAPPPPLKHVADCPYNTTKGVLPSEKNGNLQVWSGFLKSR